jgi:hypothetical protein
MIPSPTGRRPFPPSRSAARLAIAGLTTEPPAPSRPETTPADSSAVPLKHSLLRQTLLLHRPSPLATVINQAANGELAQRFPSPSAPVLTVPVLMNRRTAGAMC